ncbi:YnfA family protein [Providencia hangzhouensis]|uniref:YnfA family protein n=1 Tax=Providencia hangzhouensis TaxID=3031799 RepID=UPI003F692A82
MIPAALSLMLFSGYSHYTRASGRIYATYGGIYIVTALAWLKVVEGVSLTVTDWVGALVVLIGAVSLLVVGNRIQCYHVTLKN